MTIKAKPLAAVVFGISAIFVLSAMQLGHSEVAERPDTSGETRAASPAPIAPRSVAGLGVIEPEGGEIDLASQMFGVVSVVHVKEGDPVRRDAVIAELANDDLKARVAQAHATLAIKTVDLQRLQNGPRRQEILQAEAKLREEDAALKLLKLQSDRRGNLVRRGAIAKETSDSAITSLATGQQRRDTAAQALSILREGTRTEDIASAQAQVELAEHQVDEAVANLGKSYIRASSDGVVLRLYKEPGEAVSIQPAVPVVQIGDTSRLVVRTQIDEGDIAPLQVGQTAEISAPALGGRKLKGRVSRISPRLGAKTITAGSPTEKRDARVLDVIVALDPGVSLPISLRVDVFIDVETKPEPVASNVMGLATEWSFRL